MRQGLFAGRERRAREGTTGIDGAIAMDGAISLPMCRGFRVTALNFTPPRITKVASCFEA
jgi:hypothetical protein